MMSWSMTPMTQKWGFSVLRVVINSYYIYISTVDEQVSTRFNSYQQLSTVINSCQQISTVVNKFQQFSTNFNSRQQISTLLNNVSTEFQQNFNRISTEDRNGFPPKYLMEIRNPQNFKIVIILYTNGRCAHPNHHTINFISGGRAKPLVFRACTRVLPDLPGTLVPGCLLNKHPTVLCTYCST